MKTIICLLILAAIAPEQRDPKRLWCGEHDVYEDECFICHPELKTKPAEASQKLWCKEHNFVEEECGICHPELAAKLQPGQSLKIRFASTEAAGKAGIRTIKPRVAPMADGVECYAEVQFNQNKLAQIAPPVAGTIHSVEVDAGSRVQEGAALVKISSPEIVKMRLAKQNLERERKLRAERISSEKDLQQAEAEYEQLKALGFELTGDSAWLELRAPFDGEIVERNAVRGAWAEAGKPLFTLADRSTMWAILNIPEKQLGRVQTGQSIELRVDALPGLTFTGQLSWVAAQIDDRTRMVKARAEIPNPTGQLRAQMFGHARVVTGNSDPAVIVPRSAMQQLDGKPFVFVKIADDVYEARAVRVGAKLNGDVAIAEGLKPDEQVVVEGSFIAKSQFLISRLGAGCVDD